MRSPNVQGPRTAPQQVCYPCQTYPAPLVRTRSSRRKAHHTGEPVHQYTGDAKESRHNVTTTRTPTATQQKPLSRQPLSKHDCAPAPLSYPCQEPPPLHFTHFPLPEHPTPSHLPFADTPIPQHAGPSAPSTSHHSGGELSRRLVSTSQPSLVTTTWCSNCALREPSSVTAVQPSGHVRSRHEPGAGSVTEREKVDYGQGCCGSLYGAVR